MYIIVFEIMIYLCLFYNDLILGLKIKMDLYYCCKYYQNQYKYQIICICICIPLIIIIIFNTTYFMILFYFILLVYIIHISIYFYLYKIDNNYLYMCYYLIVYKKIIYYYRLQDLRMFCYLMMVMMRYGDININMGMGMLLYM